VGRPGDGKPHREDTCSKAVVQFLDDNGGVCRLSTDSDSRGRRRFLRTYTFDYTNDGFERAQGFVYWRDCGSKRWVSRVTDTLAIVLHTHSNPLPMVPLPPAELVQRASLRGSMFSH